LRVPIGLAGFPPTMVYGATSLVTIAPAATTAPSPIVTPGRMTEWLETHARSPIDTGAPVSSNEGELTSCSRV
jgi:hypothetical protein